MGARRYWPHIKHLSPGRSHSCHLSSHNLAPTLPPSLRTSPAVPGPSLPQYQLPGLPLFLKHTRQVSPQGLCTGHSPSCPLGSRTPLPHADAYTSPSLTGGLEEGLDPQSHPPSLSWPPPSLGVSLPGIYHHLTCDIFLLFILISVCIPPLESKLYEGRDFPSTLTRHSWNE